MSRLDGYAEPGVVAIVGPAAALTSTSGISVAGGRTAATAAVASTASETRAIVRARIRMATRDERTSIHARRSSGQLVAAGLVLSSKGLGGGVWVSAVGFRSGSMDDPEPREVPMKRTTMNVGGSKWLHVLIGVLFLNAAALAAPSAAPSAAAPNLSPTPAPAPVVVKAPTYKLLSVEPDVEIEKTKGRRRRPVGPRPRAIRLKFDQATYLWALRGAIAVIPDVDIDWHRSEQVDDSEVKLVGAFERDKKYELLVTGWIPNNDRTAQVETGRFEFTLPASSPAVEFVKPVGGARAQFQAARAPQDARRREDQADGDRGAAGLVASRRPRCSRTTRTPATRPSTRRRTTRATSAARACRWWTWPCGTRACRRSTRC